MSDLQKARDDLRKVVYIIHGVSLAGAFATEYFTKKDKFKIWRAVLYYMAASGFAHAVSVESVLFYDAPLEEVEEYINQNSSWFGNSF